MIASSIKSINYISKIPYLRHSFCQNTSISSLSELKIAKKYYEQKKMGMAVEYFQECLSILPAEGSESFNEEYEQLLNMLIKCHIWRGDITKAKHLISNITQIREQSKGKLSQELLSTQAIFSLTNLQQNVLKSKQHQALRQNLRRIKQKYGSQRVIVEEQITRNIQQTQVVIPNNKIDSWLHASLSNTFAYIITSLISQPPFSKHPSYNQLCKSYLKNTERSSQKNVVKPLIILSANLLKNNKFLQTEGMLNYCIDKKKENVPRELLSSNQEFMLMKLLLAKVLDGVNRLQESVNIRKQFGSGLNLQALVIQSCLLDSV